MLVEAWQVVADHGTTTHDTVPFSRFPGLSAPPCPTTPIRVTQLRESGKRNDTDASPSFVWSNSTRSRKVEGIEQGREGGKGGRIPRVVGLSCLPPSLPLSLLLFPHRLLRGWWGPPPLPPPSPFLVSAPRLRSPLRSRARVRGSVGLAPAVSRWLPWSAHGCLRIVYPYPSLPPPPKPVSPLYHCCAARSSPALWYLCVSPGPGAAVVTGWQWPP